jgi:hypothetical protein
MYFERYSSNIQKSKIGRRHRGSSISSISQQQIRLQPSDRYLSYPADRCDLCHLCGELNCQNNTNVRIVIPFLASHDTFKSVNFGFGIYRHHTPSSQNIKMQHPNNHPQFPPPPPPPQPPLPPGWERAFDPCEFMSQLTQDMNIISRRTHLFILY